MKFIPYILGLLCFSNAIVVAQSNFQTIGDPDAIVFDLEIDEKKKSLLASTPENVQEWNYDSKVLLKQWNFSNVQDLDQLGNSVAGVSKSGTLFVWKPQQNDAGREYKITTAPLNCLAWIDSAWIAVGSNDGMIYKVNSRTGEIHKSVKSKGSITSMAKSKNWLLVGTSTGELAIYFTDEFTPKKFLQAHKTWIRDIHVLDSTETFVTVADDAKLKRWTSEFALESELGFLSGWLTSVDFIADKQKLIAFAVGKLAGNLEIHTGLAKYYSKANASINKIILFRMDLPKLKVIVATHGGGIQVWDTNHMKLKAY